MSDASQYSRDLEVTNLLREATIDSAIRSLALPQGSSGLDVGCGIGLQSVQLAEVVGSDGRVTGVDVEPEFLTRAREMVARLGLSERVFLQQGDMHHLPFDDDSFDWVWSADCVGYGTLDPVPVVEELARVVRGGGRVVILAWSSEKLLPGYPRLEARLNATSSGIAPFRQSSNPSRHFSRALGWFHEVGLENAVARTFVGDVHAPLSDDLRAALIALIRMRWPGVHSELSQDDWALYQRICEPESPEFILDFPDYYAFFTYSLFSGTVPQ